MKTHRPDDPDSQLLDVHLDLLPRDGHASRIPRPRLHLKHRLEEEGDGRERSRHGSRDGEQELCTERGRESSSDGLRDGKKDGRGKGREVSVREENGATKKNSRSGRKTV